MRQPGKATVAEVQERFATWRSSRSKKGRIPDELWAAAVEVARRDGVNRTAQALHLDGGKLMRRLVAAGDDDKQGQEAAPATFVEFVSTSAGDRIDCVVEAESAHAGAVRIHLKSVTIQDVAQLSRTLLGRT